MWLLISFVIVIFGGINWLLIGLLQYDFVAGIFGFQSSLLSRIIYIAIGLATCFLIFKTLVQKGKLELFQINFRRFSKKKEEPAPPETKVEEPGSLNDFK